MTYHTEQLVHVICQLIRFSSIFAAGVREPVRLVQFGYNYGRLLILLQRMSDRVNATPITNQALMIKFLLDHLLLNDYSTDSRLVDYGYCLGILQEARSESQERWWRPLVEPLRQRDWSTVANLVRQNIAECRHPWATSQEFVSLLPTTDLDWKKETRGIQLMCEHIVVGLARL